MASLIKRGKSYYAQYSNGVKARRISLRTDSLQVAKHKLRELESARVRQDDLPFPTRTKLSDLLEEYVAHIRQHKAVNTVKADLFYLREAFGQCCPSLEVPRGNQQKNKNMIDIGHLEDLTTAEVSRFLARQVQLRGLAPKTANRYRETLHTFVNWAMNERGLRMPNGANPITKVARDREKAQIITYLTLEQIEQQLEALGGSPLIQTMVAVYIYAGLRREETLWLTRKDIDLKSGKYGVIKVLAKTVHGKQWQAKTGVDRVVPISSALRSYLDQYTPMITPEHWYFPTPTGCQWNPDNFSRSLRQLNKGAKLTWSCADYRHTFGTHLVSNGESLYKVATLMGNSPEICRRHYATFIPESLYEAVEFGNGAKMECK